MRILQVINFFSPLHGGGSIEVAYQLSRTLVRRGQDVTIYTSDFELDQEYINSLSGVKIYPFHSWLNLAGFHLTPGVISTLKKELKNFDVIHLHNYRTFQNIVVHHYAKKHDIPHILQAHGSLTTYFQKGMLKKIFDRLWGYRILNDASKVIALTKTEAEQYKSMGVSEDKIEIVPNGIDLSEFENLPQRGEFRKKHSLDNNQKIILYLGRIHKIKGLDLLAKAFAELSKEVSDARLVIAGPDDGYLPHLRKLVADLGISDKVLFTGPLYQKDKLEVYADADVYVLPSSYEIFGITLLEAMACDTPIVVTDRCGCNEWIKESCAGYVVKYGDVSGLKEQTIKCLSSDPEIKRMVQQGKEYIYNNLDWAHVTHEIENIYAVCINKGE